MSCLSPQRELGKVSGVLRTLFCLESHAAVSVRAEQRRTPFGLSKRGAGAARRALLALGGNGSLRAFNQPWSHSPTREAEQALDPVDSRLAEKLPG